MTNAFAPDAPTAARILRSLQGNPFNAPIAQYAELYGDLTALPLRQQREIINAVRYCDVCDRWYDREDPCPYH